MGKVIVLPALLALVLAVGCSNYTEITGAEKDQVLKYAEPIVDGVLSGYTTKNYELFSKDFDAKMKSTLTQAVFNGMHDQIFPKIGGYKSRAVSKVQKNGPYVRVIYKAAFADESDVVVKVIFQNNSGVNQVTGLWFDSPKLRK